MPYNVLSKPLLVIDPGHGGKDPGAVSKYGHEEDWTLKISLYQFERFKELGLPVAITRTTDKDLDSGPRTAAVRNSGATYCISNHLNAGGGDRAEVIHSIYDSGQLANQLKEALLSAGQNAVKVYCKKGSNGKDYYYMHRETGAVKTNIVEYCFIDNEADFKHFEANWKNYAEAIVRAFCSFVGHPYKAPAKPTGTKSTVNVSVSPLIERAKTLGITDGKNPERVAQQYYTWAVVLPVMERVVKLEQELKELKARLK